MGCSVPLLMTLATLLGAAVVPKHFAVTAHCRVGLRVSFRGGPGKESSVQVISPSLSQGQQETERNQWLLELIEGR